MTKNKSNAYAAKPFFFVSICAHANRMLQSSTLLNHYIDWFSSSKHNCLNNINPEVYIKSILQRKMKQMQLIWFGGQFETKKKTAYYAMETSKANVNNRIEDIKR